MTCRVTLRMLMYHCLYNSFFSYVSSSTVYVGVSLPKLCQCRDILLDMYKVSSYDASGSIVWAKLSLLAVSSYDVLNSAVHAGVSLTVQDLLQCTKQADMSDCTRSFITCQAAPCILVSLYCTSFHDVSGITAHADVSFSIRSSPMTWQAAQLMLMHIFARTMLVRQYRYRCPWGTSLF